MTVVVLPRQDPVLEDKDNYAQIDGLWIANLVDTFNSAIQQIEDELALMDARLTAGGL